MSHITRTKTGCVQCRLRRVRCDKRPESCGNCEKAALLCPGYSEDAQPISLMNRDAIKPQQPHLRAAYTAAGTKRRRHTEACVECRRLKERCSGERPICARCQRIGKPCHYRSEQAQRPTAGNPSSSLFLSQRSGQEQPFLPSRETIVRLWDIFFQYIAPLQCLAFVHKPSMMEELDTLAFDRSSDTALWLAMCVLGTTATVFDRQLDMEADWEEQGKIWFKEVSAVINLDMLGITIKNLMCLVLLLEYALRRELYDQAFLMAGSASRMTQALQLNLERDSDVLSLINEPGRIPALEKEVRRRLMWSIYLIDANIASGVDQLKLVRAEDLKIQLPTHDHNFMHQIAARTERLHAYADCSSPLLSSHHDATKSQNPQMGLQAYFICMRHIKSKILSYIKKLSESLPPWDAQSTFYRLVHDLDQLCTDLPRSIQYSSTSIRLHQGSANLAAFYALHLGIDQCYCDLYRLSIPEVCFPSAPIVELSKSAPPEFIASTRDKLFGHARQQSLLIGDIVRLQDEHAFADWGIGIHAHEAVKYQVIYIMTALTDNSKRTSVILDIIPGVEDSFRVMQRLSTYYGQMASKFLLSLIKLLVDYNFPVDVLSSYLTRTIANANEESVESDETQDETDSEPLPDAQKSVDDTLHPLSLFALVRSTLNPREKHVPEKSRRRRGVSTTILPNKEAEMLVASDGADARTAGADEDAHQYWGEFVDEFDFSQQVFPGDFGGFLGNDRDE